MEVNVSSELLQLDSVFRAVSEAGDLASVQAAYRKLLEAASVLFSLKNRLLVKLSQFEVDNRDLLEQQIRRLISKGFHYEERKQFMELQGTSSIIEARRMLRLVNEKLDMLKFLEQILSRYFSVLVLEYNLSKTGHD